MSRDTDNAGKFMWFVAGAAIGAAIALLYAPSSGEDLRRKIGEKTDEGRSALLDSSKELLDRGRDLYEKGRKMADDAADLFEKGRKIVQG